MENNLVKLIKVVNILNNSKEWGQYDPSIRVIDADNDVQYEMQFAEFEGHVVILTISYNIPKKEYVYTFGHCNAEGRSYDPFATIPSEITESIDTLRLAIEANEKGLRSYQFDRIIV